MKTKDLKHLRRDELLQLLIQQKKENEQLREELAQAQKQLEERQLVLEEAGSIAEAALRLNGVFQAAQEAASQYLESVEALHRRQCQQTVEGLL